MSAMTPAELQQLPAVFDRATAGRALGCSEWTVRQMQARGELRTLRIGRLAKVRLVDVLELLGITSEMATPGSTNPGAALTPTRPLGGPDNGQSARPLRAVNPS